jgi:hypothetical protein
LFSAMRDSGSLWSNLDDNISDRCSDRDWVDIRAVCDVISGRTQRLPARMCRYNLPDGHKSFEHRLVNLLREASA